MRHHDIACNNAVPYAQLIVEYFNRLRGKAAAREKSMQVAVVGAGAVGCYYGGLLLRAGHDVTFIGRQPHVDAINAHGLLLDTKSFNGRLPAKAATDATALASPDLVLVCVKSADTEQAGRSLAGQLAAGNIRSQPAERRRQCAASCRGHRPRRHSRRGLCRQRDGRARPCQASRRRRSRHRPLCRSEALAQTLEAAGIRITIADDIDRTLWSKLVINCAFNALSAVAAFPTADAGSRGHRDVVTRAVQEAIAVARACGVSMPEDLLEQILKIPTMMPNQMSSTAQDLRAASPARSTF
jgi:2-dehydropantoate 2-reductase